MAPTASHESLGQGYAHSCDSVDNMSDCSTPTGQSRLNFTGATIHDVPVAIGTPQPVHIPSDGSIYGVCTLVTGVICCTSSAATPRMSHAAAPEQIAPSCRTNVTTFRCKCRWPLSGWAVLSRRPMQNNGFYPTQLPPSSTSPAAPPVH